MIREMADTPSRSQKRAEKADAKEFAEEVCKLLREAKARSSKGATRTKRSGLAAILSFIPQVRSPSALYNHSTTR